jgi:hypothetical protein
VTRDERRERQLADDMAAERIAATLADLVDEDDWNVILDRGVALARIRLANRAGDIARLALDMSRGGGES